jgi:hypothetical protein
LQQIVCKKSGEKWPIWKFEGKIVFIATHSLCMDNFRRGLHAEAGAKAQFTQAICKKLARLLKTR